MTRAKINGSRPVNFHLEANAHDQIETQNSFPKLIILNDRPPIPNRWIVEGILLEEACTIVGAEEKTGKSWLLFLLAICIVSGRKVMDIWQPKKKGKVLIYSPESGWESKRARLWGLCLAMGLDPEVVLKSIPMVKSQLDLSQKEQIEQMKSIIAKEKPVLLILDPLIACSSGVDENSSRKMQPILNSIRELREFNPSMGIMVAHHLNKSHKNKSPFHGLRGSSALGAWADGLVMIRKSLPSDPNCTRRVDIDHRDAPSPDPIGFDIEQVNPEGEAPDEICRFRLEPCEPPEIEGKETDGNEGRGRPMDLEVTETVFRYVSELKEKYRYTVAAKELGIAPSTFKRHIERLETFGRIHFENGCPKVSECFDGK